MAARKSKGVHIETLLNNPSVKVTRTTMQPGAEIPQQGRGSDYVIFPVTKFRVSRRFSRNGVVTREVKIQGTPGKPYFARSSRRGTEFSLVNTADDAIVFDKVILKRS